MEEGKISVEKNKFMVVLLGVIFDTKTKKILIGRREDDPHVKELSWVFPGGNANPDEELEETLKKKIRESTGIETENLGSVFSRIFPENKEIITIYYLCESVGGKEKPKGSLKELKWVSPEELENKFTTSLHPSLKEYIMNLK